jgi:diadenylate cyclase
VELFKVGFVTVTLIDVIDILIVTYIFYKLYVVMRGTIASQIFIGLILIIIFSIVAQTFNMKSLGWIFSKLTDIWVIAFVILFQPEIRRLLLLIGRTRFARFFFKISATETINEVIDALKELRERQLGAIIVISRGGGLTSFIETGEPLAARVNKELLISIFNARSPLHDGAVIIQNDVIEAARCILPLSATEKLGTWKLGTRHRAALGVSEQVNCLAIVLSEETGNISVAQDGELTICSDYQELRKLLRDVFEGPGVKKSVERILERMED